MRRSRIDIIIDVLEVAIMGINKTSVVYKSNLNFKVAHKYLELLQKHGLVEKRENIYITTEKGNIFLKKAKELTSQI
jgi:predicted transcriptional regulator